MCVLFIQQAERPCLLRKRFQNSNQDTGLQSCYSHYRTGEYDFSVDIVVLEILRSQSITTHLCLDVIALIPAPSASQLHTIIIFPALSPRALCLPLLYPPIWWETALPLVEHNRCCTLAASSFNPLLYLPPCKIEICPQIVT